VAYLNVAVRLASGQERMAQRVNRTVWVSFRSRFCQQNPPGSGRVVWGTSECNIGLSAQLFVR